MQKISSDSQKSFCSRLAKSLLDTIVVCCLVVLDDVYDGLSGEKLCIITL